MLDTTRALSEQFIISLSSPPPQSPASEETPSPLSLLSASAEALKSQTAKVSLLAINSPFTASAVVDVLSAVNDSVLPSLVTAAHLTDPQTYTPTFQSETNVLVKIALRELLVLVGGIKTIATKNGRDVSEEEKSAVTTTTGRVWKACDQLMTLSKDGVLGFVIRKAKQYLELVKDGIQELREWDPADHSDYNEDDIWGSGSDDDAGAAANDTSDRAGADDDGPDDHDKTLKYARIREEQKHMLRVFNHASQIYPRIVSQRLKRTGEWSRALVPCVESLVSCFHGISDSTDEAAGSLYEANIEDATEYTDKVLERAITAVTASRDFPHTHVGAGTDTADSDEFTKWAAVWLSVAEEVRKSKSTEVGYSHVATAHTS